VFVLIIGHFDNEIQFDKINKIPASRAYQHRPQVDKYTSARPGNLPLAKAVPS